MAPELILHDICGDRETYFKNTDIYSLGATLYYAMMLKPPYDKKDIQFIMHQQGFVNNNDSLFTDYETTSKDKNKYFYDLIRDMMKVPQKEKPDAGMCLNNTRISIDEVIERLGVIIQKLNIEVAMIGGGYQKGLKYVFTKIY